MRKTPNYVQKSLCYGIDTVIHGRKRRKKLKNVRERNNKNKLESIEEQAEKKFKHQNTDKNLFRSYPTVVNTKHSVDTDKFQTQKTKTNVKSVGCSAFLYKETQRQRWKRWNAKSKKYRYTIYIKSQCVLFCWSCLALALISGNKAPNGSALTRSKLTYESHRTKWCCRICCTIFMVISFFFAFLL